MKYQFTNNWFQITAKGWDRFPKAKDILEVGSFEGQSSVWMIENMLTDEGTMICIDSWEGGEDHEGIDFKEVEDRFETNIKSAKRAAQKIYKVKGKSIDGLATCITGRKEFDFIYIDGSHVAKDVLTDACMAWSMLKTNGILVFDDYFWGPVRDILHRPKFAIDVFANLFVEELQVIEAGSQFIVRKK